MSTPERRKRPAQAANVNNYMVTPTDANHATAGRDCQVDLTDRTRSVATTSATPSIVTSLPKQGGRHG